MRTRSGICGVLAAALVVAAGCATLYTGIVTLTEVVDAGMKDWAQLSVAGKTSPALDAKVVAAHDRYRGACGVAQTALIAYKNGGDANQYVVALQAARGAADGLFELITPLLAPGRAAELKSQLTKASRP